jgi:TldD protein
MQEVSRRAVEAALAAGATYADARVVETRQESITVKNGAVQRVRSIEDRGIGVRVIADGAWGFAAASEVTRADVRKTAALAVKIARASARVAGPPIRLSPVEPTQAVWASPRSVDPFTIPLEQKLDLLLQADRELRRSPAISVATSDMGFARERKWFASSDGSDIEQDTLQSGAMLQATAVDGTEVQTRSYPSFEGFHQLGGWEVIEGMKLLEGAEQSGREAAELLTADVCPSGEMTIILGSAQLALQVHESCGHPIELDRVLGTEISLAGSSFLTPDKLDGFRYGSDIVNITADATVPGGLGTFAYDDEGVPAQRTPIVEAGIFRGYLTSRETAPTVGRASSGAMRADGWGRLPLIRMTNINLEPGTWTLEDMIADTSHGIMMENTKSWSIDDRRLNFQFSCEIGWEIKDGRRGRMLRNPSYQGITPEFWGACNAIANRDHWTLWGVTNCGKGEPMQVMRVGHGTAPARFERVRVGIG